MNVAGRRARAARLLGVAAFMACGACGSDSGGGEPAAPSDAGVDAASSPSTDAGQDPEGGPARPLVNDDGVRLCDFVPGESEPVTIPSGVLVEAPPVIEPAPLPEPTPVPAATTERQLDVLGGLEQAVIDHYVDPTFNGEDWDAIATRYRALVGDGLDDEGFAAAMQAMIAELGDGHSYFQSPEAVAADEMAIAEGRSFVGVGFLALPVGDFTTASIVALWPGGPAAEAGLRPHDRLLEVDGLAPRDELGRSRTLGPAGTSFELTYQRPGQDEETITLTRRAVMGPIPVDYCLFPGTRIGYVMVPTFLDESIDDQLVDALEHMSAGRALHGLVFDNRMNGGGLGSVAQDTLALFVDGDHGSFVERSGEEPLVVAGRDVDGSQTVPLVVLVDRDTVSYGEVVSGVLQVAGRATVVGAPSAGNVEQLRRFDFSDGSRAWLAAATFAPQGLAAGAWEGVGIEPDVSEPTRWDQLTEATDPALARSLELLQ